MDGHENRRVRVFTELIMEEAQRRIEERKEAKLTVGQYNSVYEAVQKLLDGNV